MAKLLHQDVILDRLKSHGLETSREELGTFLDANTTIGTLTIQPRGRGIDPAVDGVRPHTSRWYDVLSPHFTAEQANDHIVEHIRKSGLRAK